MLDEARDVDDRRLLAHRGAKYHGRGPRLWETFGRARYWAISSLSRFPVRSAKSARSAVHTIRRYQK